MISTDRKWVGIISAQTCQSFDRETYGFTTIRLHPTFEIKVRVSSYHCASSIPTPWNSQIFGLITTHIQLCAPMFLANAKDPGAVWPPTAEVIWRPELHGGVPSSLDTMMRKKMIEVDTHWCSEPLALLGITASAILKWPCFVLHR